MFGVLRNHFDIHEYFRIIGTINLSTGSQVALYTNKLTLDTAYGYEVASVEITSIEFVFGLFVNE